MAADRHMAGRLADGDCWMRQLVALDEARTSPERGVDRKATPARGAAGPIPAAIHVQTDTLLETALPRVDAGRHNQPDAMRLVVYVRVDRRRYRNSLARRPGNGCILVRDGSDHGEPGSRMATEWACPFNGTYPG